MPTGVKLPDPARFGLARFAELLPPREHIVGEDPGSFDGFHAGLMQSLAPITPYEGVIAENLVAIEWELIQHRRMRDAGLRAVIRDAISKAVNGRERAVHAEALDDLFEKHLEAGGTEDDWQQPFPFDTEAVDAKGRDLAARAISQNLAERAQASKEIGAMGLNVVELMGEAYRTLDRQVRHHDTMGQELERRRRDVRSDFDRLQRARPVEAEVIEG